MLHHESGASTNECARGKRKERCERRESTGIREKIEEWRGGSGGRNINGVGDIGGKRGEKGREKRNG